MHRSLNFVVRSVMLAVIYGVFSVAGFQQDFVFSWSFLLTLLLSRMPELFHYVYYRYTDRPRDAQTPQ